MKLVDYIKERKEKKGILIMAHQILGYPDFPTNRAMLELFQEYGVDMVELQIPFSDPMADGPTFLKANQDSLERGTTLAECFEHTREFCKDFSFPILYMTYYNIVFNQGIENFMKKAAATGVRGTIVPDALPENSGDYLEACKKERMAPVLLVTPYTPDERMQKISAQGEGFIYCVPRKGVTGSKTDFNTETFHFLERCRKNLTLPTGVGFGIQSRQDIENLKGKTDIAIIGSHFLRLLEEEGLKGVETFLKKIG